MERKIRKVDNPCFVRIWYYHECKCSVSHLRYNQAYRYTSPGQLRATPHHTRHSCRNYGRYTCPQLNNTVLPNIYNTIIFINRHGKETIDFWHRDPTRDIYLDEGVAQDQVTFEGWFRGVRLWFPPWRILFSLFKKKTELAKATISWSINQPNFQQPKIMMSFYTMKIYYDVSILLFKTIGWCGPI